MKSIKLKYLLLLALPLFLFSCSDIERFPFNSISKDQSFEQPSDAQKWDNGLYSTFRARQYGIYTYSTDVQADELNATLDYGNRNGFPHRWNGFLASDYTIRDVWEGYYSAITNLNIIINSANQIKTETPADDSLINGAKGDAFLARAFYYQELLLRWAKPYDPSSASSDPGVPLVLKYDVNEKPSRATITEVYNRILSDLDSAQQLLKGVPGGQGATKFNRDVVLAQLARTKLYMQDWPGAEKSANSLINSGTYPLIDNQADLVRMWRDDYPQEVIFQSFVSAPNELANTNSIYLGYNVAANYFDPDFIPSKWVVDLFPDNDIRRTVYFSDTGLVHVQGNDYTGIYLVNKYPGNPNLWTSASTNYEQAPKVFRIAEMYLISSEAAHKQGKDEEARKTLNVLRTKRGLSSIPPSVTGNQLMDSIKMERLRELAFEGFRLDDLKRWHEGFQRHDPQNTNLLTPGEDFYTKKVAPDADKYVWGIPTRDMTVNPNLKGEQNPGW